MIAFNRTAAIAPGRTASAINFAHDVAAYLKKSYDLDLEVLLPIGGNPSRIAWSTRYKDMASLDAVNTKMLSDKHYWDMIHKNSDNFLAGSVRDAFWRTV